MQESYIVPGKNKECPSCKAVGRDRTGDHLVLFSNGNRNCSRCDLTYNEITHKIWNHGNLTTDKEVLDGLPVTSSGMVGASNASIGGHVFNDLSLGQSDVEHQEGTVQGQPGPSNIPEYTAPSLNRTWFRHSVPFRNISVEVLDEYRYEIAVHADGSPEAVSHHLFETDTDQLIGRKIRVVDDKTFKVEGGTAGKKVQLFGQNIFPMGGKRIILSEGQEDSMCCRMVMKKWKIPCVSVPLGANIQAVVDNLQYLLSFDELYFCGDQDKKGREFAAKVASVLPRMKDVRLLEKDANKMVDEGRAEELAQCIWGAEGYRPDAIVDITSLYESLLKPVEMGILTPWDNVNDITYGLMLHKIISIGAAPSVGKTIFVRAIQKHLMAVLKSGIMCISLEENAEATLRNLVGYFMGCPIQKPGVVYDPQEAIRVAELIRPYLQLYDSRYFGGKWENIKTVIRAMVTSAGVQTVWIDPVSSLVAHLDTSAANTELGVIMMDMQDLVKELPVCVVMVNHLNNKTSGTPHEAGGRVLPSEFTGSRAQQRYSDVMIGLERDTLNEDPEIKNVTTVRNIKCRVDGGLQGKTAYLKYEDSTGHLTPVHPPAFPPATPGEAPIQGAGEILVPYQQEPI